MQSAAPVTTRRLHNALDSRDHEVGPVAVDEVPGTLCNDQLTGAGQFRMRYLALLPRLYGDSPRTHPG